MGKGGHSDIVGGAAFAAASSLRVCACLEPRLLWLFTTYTDSTG